LGAAFLVWFGVSKIRLRGRLGGVALLVGWVEILMVVLFAGMLAWFVSTLLMAVRQPGVTEEALEAFLDRGGQTALLIGIALTVVWGGLQLLLLGTVGGRLASNNDQIRPGV